MTVITKSLLTFLMLTGCMLVVSCANLRDSLEPPKIQLESVQMLESRGLSQRFRLGLRVINPNDRSLPVRGISYTLALNGFDLLQGVSADIPTLGPFSEAVLHIDATTDIVAALRFINEFVTGDSQDLRYALNADISVQGVPGKLRVRDSGEVPLLRAAP